MEPMREQVPGADHRVLFVGAGGAGRRAAAIVAIGLLVGLLLGAAPLRQWTETLPDVWGATALHDAAVTWEQAMGRAGLTRPYAVVRGWIRGAEGPPA